MASKSSRTCAPSVCPNCRVHAMYVCVCVCVCACVRVYVCAHKFVFVRTTAAPAQALSFRDHIYLSLSPSLSSARALFPPSLLSLSVPPFSLCPSLPSLSLSLSLTRHTHTCVACITLSLSLSHPLSEQRALTLSVPPSFPGH